MTEPDKVVLQPDLKQTLRLGIALSCMSVVFLVLTPVLAHFAEPQRPATPWRQSPVAWISLLLGIVFFMTGICLVSWFRWRRHRWEGDGTGIRVFKDNKLIHAYPWSVVSNLDAQPYGVRLWAVQLLSGRATSEAPSQAVRRCKERIHWARFADAKRLHSLYTQHHGEFLNNPHRAPTVARTRSALLKPAAVYGVFFGWCLSIFLAVPTTHYVRPHWLIVSVAASAFVLFVASFLASASGLIWKSPNRRALAWCLLAASVGLLWSSVHL